MKRLNMGIIGLGHVYEYQRQALDTIEAIHIKAICDIDEERARAEAYSLGTSCYTDYDELIQNKEIDAVLVSTPVNTHYEIARNALAAKKHVLIEKPATLDIRQLIDLQEIATTNGVNMVVAFHASFAKDLLWFKEEYDNELYEELGPIVGMDCQFLDPYINNGVVENKALSLVGSWIDSGVNALSVVSRLIDPRYIYLKGKLLINRESYATPNISATVIYNYVLENQQSCEIAIKTDWTVNKNLKFSVLYFEDNKKIILQHSEQKVILVNRLNEIIVMKDFSAEDSRMPVHYKGVFNDFIEKINNGEDNFYDALRIHQLLLIEE